MLLSLLAPLVLDLRDFHDLDGNWNANRETSDQHHVTWLRQNARSKLKDAEHLLLASFRADFYTPLQTEKTRMAWQQSRELAPRLDKKI